MEGKGLPPRQWPKVGLGATKLMIKKNNVKFKNLVEKLLMNLKFRSAAES